MQYSKLILGPFVVFLFLNSCAAQSARHLIAVTRSMSPMIEIGDHCFASGNSSSSDFPIKRFDIVFYRHPSDPRRRIDENTLFTHRVIGLPGEKIEIRNGVVYINDSALDESAFEKRLGGKDVKAFIIPDNEYFLMGDNRPDSEDSRYVGTVKRESIDSVVNRIVKKSDYDSGKR